MSHSLITKPSLKSFSLLLDIIFFKSFEFRLLQHPLWKECLYHTYGIHKAPIRIWYGTCQNYDLVLIDFYINIPQFIIVLLNLSRWFLMNIPLFIWRVNNCFFKYKQAVITFIIPKLFSFKQNLAPHYPNIKNNIMHFFYKFIFSSIDIIACKAFLPSIIV